MSEIAGPTFGDLQNTVDQITRVLPTAAVTGFHFIAAQISPDSLCTESQRIAFAIFISIFSILCAILAVVDRQQAPKRIAAAIAQPLSKSPRKTTRKKPAPEPASPVGRSRTPKRASTAGRQLQSASPTRRGRGRPCKNLQSASPARPAVVQRGQTALQVLVSRASTVAKNSMLQYAVRAVMAALTFAALAVITPPGPTCLFGAGDLPSWLKSSVCATIIVVFSALAKLPGFAPVAQAKQA